ncbi:hypothetical protein [Streptomyces phaeochromogenes]
MGDLHQVDGCSPHPRGWPLAELAVLALKDLLPAPAGATPAGCRPLD